MGLRSNLILIIEIDPCPIIDRLMPKVLAENFTLTFFCAALFHNLFDLAES